MQTKTPQTIVITGASKGLGRAFANIFSQHHYNVVVNYNRDWANAQRTYEECLRKHDKVLLVQADVTQRSEVEALMKKTYESFGSIDGLINNAGLNIDKPLFDLQDEDWDRVIDTNMKSVFLCSQIASTYMLRHHGGTIVNIGAPTGLQGRKNGLNYCASKAGVLLMTQCLALELAPTIRVNSLIPGSIWTEETEHRFAYNDEQRRREKEQQIPLGYIGSPHDVANVALFLFSDQARYITGQQFIVDGGQKMR